MSNVAKDISTLLLSITQDVFIDEMQDDNDKDNIIAVFHSTGRKSYHVFGDTRAIENPSIQVRVRHRSRQNALEWCNQIKDILDGLNNFDIQDNHYILVTLSSDILSMGRDKQGRVHYSLNFSVQVKRNT